MVVDALCLCSVFTVVCDVLCLHGVCSLLLLCVCDVPVVARYPVSEWSVFTV